MTKFAFSCPEKLQGEDLGIEMQSCEYYLDSGSLGLWPVDGVIYEAVL